MIARSSIDRIGLIHRNSSIVASISSSSVQDTNSGEIRYVGNLINYTATESSFCSINEPNQFFDISFVKLIHIYNISLYATLKEYPQSINIQGYNGGEQCYSKTYHVSMSKAKEIITFPTLNCGPFDRLSIQMIGENGYKNNYFCLNKFDIFGFFTVYLSYRKKNYISSRSLIIMFMLNQ